MSDYAKELCERVKLARTKNTDLTQDQMADAIGAGRSAYRHYEGGRYTKMPHQYMPKFCEITKVNREWLLTGEGDMKGEASELEKIVNELSPSSREELLTFAKFLRNKE